MNPDADRPRERDRRLRAESTTAEQKLWRHLRAKRFAGLKFLDNTGLVIILPIFAAFSGA